IRKAFEVEIGVRVLFEQPTIAELATAVEKALAGGQKVRTPALQRRPRSAAPDAEDLLAQLDCLSQGDAQSLLRRVLDGKHTP
ncbi:MAG TPA: phosphopantetheine-binding protein, partial [Terriglobales bacterium]